MQDANELKIAKIINSLMNKKLEVSYMVYCDDPR